ncbi:MAG: hypothetical protein DRR16_16895 [Candidatus Parabeggiatoa sp. nov. 3]|nr:MAG: hypothetical protein DRR00_09585 [Gammaproteobacteria bacterium]RKZ67937.1 MAG: hypothetical protein DRQ99_05225 [Gammaproteobacteria bacterium]RKZ83611.1 MAG: hypothetical protein DRR16_16895 [Gammaproteobacteria bacterium]
MLFQHFLMLKTLSNLSNGINPTILNNDKQTTNSLQIINLMKSGMIFKAFYENEKKLKKMN